MYFDGFLVIDHKNQPLRAFQGIPLTLSSKIEGWRAEAIRRADPRIRNMDLMARMPVKVEPSANGRPTRKPMVLENTLAGRQSRFRENAGAITWGKGGAKNVRDFFWALLPQHCKDNNLALPRDLTPTEKWQLLELNVGTKPEKARNAPKTDKGMTREQYIDGIRSRAAGQQGARGGNVRRLHKQIVRGRREATAETQPEASTNLQDELELAPHSPAFDLTDEQVHYPTTSASPAPATAPVFPIVPAAIPAPTAMPSPAAMPSPFAIPAPVLLAAPVIPAAPIALTASVTPATVPVPVPAPAPLLRPVPQVPVLRTRGRGPKNPPFPFVRPGEYLLVEDRFF